MSIDLIDCADLVHRWCRTYFLARGKYFENIVDVEALVESQNFTNEESKSSDSETRSTIDRLESLYFKLSTSLRWAVRQAFVQYNDILDAGGAIQVRTITITINN